MFKLLLLLCQAGDPEICVERYRFLPEPATIAACKTAERPDEVQGWEVRDVQCVDTLPEPLEVTEVAPGVFVHEGAIDIARPGNRGDLANIGFIVGDEAVAVIDAGGSALVAEALFAAIKARTQKPVTALILTHMHPDHTLGAPVFKAYGAKVYGHASLADALANRVETYSRNLEHLLGPAAYAGSGVVVPDVAVGERMELDLGGRVLVLKRHPTAHTDNDLTVFDIETRTLWASDLVFAGHIPALDGSITGWLAVLETLGVGAARVVPGHGPAVLDLPEGLAATQAYLEAIAAETRAAIASGISLRAAIETVGESQRGTWMLFDEFNPRNATAAYTELEWE